MSAGGAAWHLAQSAIASTGLSAANAPATSATDSTTDTKITLIIDTTFFIVSPPELLYACKPIRALKGYQILIYSQKTDGDNVTIYEARQW